MCSVHFRLRDVRNLNCCQALLNPSSLIKQTLPAFNKIASLCDFRLFEALGLELSQLCWKKKLLHFSPRLLRRIRSFLRILFFFY